MIIDYIKCLSHIDMGGKKFEGLTDAVAQSVNIGSAGSAGTSTLAARADHKHKLDVQTSISGSSTNSQVPSAKAVYDYNGFIKSSPTSAQAAKIHINNEARALKFYATSDERMKENIVKYENEKSLFNCVDIKRYNIKGEGIESVGLLAQELREYDPRLVTEDSDGILAVDLHGVVAALIYELGKKL